MEGEETEDCGGDGAERYYMQGVQTITGLRVQAGAFLNINNQEFGGRGRGELLFGPSRPTCEGKRKVDGTSLIIKESSALRRIKRDGQS